MAATPAYAATPRIAVVQISTANTNRDGTGTIGTVWTAGSSGSRVDRVIIEATSSTTAGMIRLFIYDGGNNYLIKEIAVSAATPSATVQTFRSEFTFDGGLMLQNTYLLKASTHNAETFNVFAIGGDF
jgi:hypothetical protein